MKEKLKMSTFLKEMAFGFFVEPWGLIVDEINWRIGTIRMILKGTDCPYSPRSCLGAFDWREQKEKQEYASIPHEGGGSAG